jgi:hypothetical protein
VDVGDVADVSEHCCLHLQGLTKVGEFHTPDLVSKPGVGGDWGLARLGEWGQWTRKAVQPALFKSPRSAQKKTAYN